MVELKRIDQIHTLLIVKTDGLQLPVQKKHKKQEELLHSNLKIEPTKQGNIMVMVSQMAMEPMLNRTTNAPKNHNSNLLIWA
jgi:hypothetical protein